MPQKWLKGIITEVLDETKTTKRFFIKVPEVEKFDFEPGQFVTIDLPIHEQKNKRWRSYSIASPPDGANGFELVIVRLEGGAGTAWFWEFGLPGTEISFMGPLGKFTLPDPIDLDLYLICTGTGIAPFRSMIRHIHAHQIPHQKIYLIFGCRTFADALYFKELKALDQDLKNFHYLPTFSREPADNHLLLRTGYVHAVYEEFIRQNNTDGSLVKAAAFYLCGWKDMIDEAKEKIQLFGYDKKAIHLELYG